MSTFIEQGQALYFSKKYAEAFPLLLQAACAGDAEAQNLLGVMYSDGLAVSRDIHQSMAWFQKAA